MESESKFYPNLTNFTLILRSYENTFCVQKEKKKNSNLLPLRHPSTILENIHWTETTYALLC